MANAKVLRIIIGIIGTVISSLVSLTRMPRFIQMYKTKSVEDYATHERHVGLLMKYSLWVLYGLPLFHKDGILVTISNGIGSIIEVIYLVSFLIYCGGNERERERRRETLLMVLFGIPIMVFFYCNSIFGRGTLSFRHTYIGVFCNVFTTSIDVITLTRSCEYVPVWFSLASLIKDGIWTAYSLIYKFDIHVLISSVLGMLLCAFQLVFCSPVIEPDEYTTGSKERDRVVVPQLRMCEV